MFFRPTDLKYKTDNDFWWNDTGSPDVLSDSEDAQTPSCGHRQPYIGFVVDELIVTERSYVKDLHDIVRVSIDLWLGFWRCGK